MSLGRNIVCSFKLAKWCQERGWKGRKVEPSIYCDYDVFYYANRKGRIRHVDVKRKLIMECDYELGFPWMKTIREGRND